MSVNKIAERLNERAQKTANTIRDIILGESDGITFEAELYESVLTAIYAYGYVYQSTDKIGSFIYAHGYVYQSTDKIGSLYFMYFIKHGCPSLEVMFDENTDIIVSHKY